MSGGSGIEKGLDWGEPSKVPTSVTVCHTDAEAADAPGPVVLTGGDLHRGLGRPTVRGVGEMSTLVHVDTMVCHVHTGEGVVTRRAVAHVVIGRILGRGRFAACLNSGFFGELSLTPRSHPGDGRIEVIEFDATMRIRDRVMARRRAMTGSHVPHPAILTSANNSWSAVRIGHESLRLDGMRIPRWHRLEIVVEPRSLPVHL